MSMDIKDKRYTDQAVVRRFFAFACDKGLFAGCGPAPQKPNELATVIDPFAGRGDILAAVDQHVVTVGVEIDDGPHERTSEWFVGDGPSVIASWVRTTTSDSEDLDRPAIVVTNPPYGSDRGFSRVQQVVLAAQMSGRIDQAWFLVPVAILATPKRSAWFGASRLHHVIVLGRRPSFNPSPELARYLESNGAPHKPGAVDNCEYAWLGFTMAKPEGDPVSIWFCA